MIKICENCGKKFTGRGNSKNCSRECTIEAERKSHGKKICPECGAEFDACSEYQVYCSGKCAAQARPLKKKICVKCGKEFETNLAYQKYCSRKCAFAAYKARHNLAVKRNCAICGKEFETNYARKKYCSAECAGQAYKARHNLTTFTKTKRNCAKCGAEFVPNNAIQKYCGAECYYETVKARSRRPSVKKICVVCGKEFETKYAYQKYCSKECAGQAYKARHNLTTFTKTKRNCVKCGAEFIPNNIVQKYCGAECQKQAHDEATRRWNAAHPRPTMKKPAQKCCSECTEAVEKSGRRKCLKCGAELPGKGLYCASCRQKIKLSREDHFEKMTREAAECGLNYGEYKLALSQGKTYDELKAAAEEKRRSAEETLKNSFLGHLFRD